MSLIMNYWFLPILFIVHDFEELIMMPLWKQRHSQKLRKLKRPFFGAVTDGSAFAVGILEELLLLVLIALYCQASGNRLFYLAVLAGYSLHFLFHYFSCFWFKGYVPGVVTAILELPLVIPMLFHYGQAVTSLWIFFLYLVVVVPLIYFNVIWLHGLMPKIEQVFEHYRYNKH